MLLAMSYVVVDIIPLHIDYSHTHQKIVIVLVILIKIGVEEFQANIIQFGADQLPDASTTEIHNLYHGLFGALQAVTC